MKPGYRSSDVTTIYNSDIALLRLVTPAPATIAKPIPINCAATVPAMNQRVAYVRLTSTEAPTVLIEYCEGA
jgi:hypothetical protein